MKPFVLWFQNSDKWCIQGGRIAGISNANTTITFKKAYKDTNYSFVSGQQNDSQTSDNYNENDWLYTKNTQSIVIYNRLSLIFNPINLKKELIFPAPYFFIL